MFLLICSNTNARQFGVVTGTRDVSGGAGGLRRAQLVAGAHVHGRTCEKASAVNALGFSVQYMWLFGVAVAVFSGTILGGKV